jgi:regulator of cell morphogenesis and NO signaling
MSVHYTKFRSATMKRPNLDVSVGQLVADDPAFATVFERFGIDYCCGGQKPLADACAERGLNPQAVLDALGAAGDLPPNATERDWNTASLTELCDHIVATHHAYLNTELPRLGTLLDKVVHAHAERHPELTDCRTVFAALRDELEAHMLKEERILFPLISQMDATQGPVVSHCGSVQNPIRVMELEHGNAGSALAQLRELTGGYKLPSDACNSYRTVLSGLAALEADLHTHIHKENNILFPRAVRLEAERNARS